MAESWRIEVSKTAQRLLRKLPHKFAAAIVEFITGPLAETPYRLSKPLHAELAAWRSARRGVYRVILRIDDDRRLLRVGRIEHRAIDKLSCGMPRDLRWTNRHSQRTDMVEPAGPSCGRFTRCDVPIAA